MLELVGISIVVWFSEHKQRIFNIWPHSK